MPALVSSLFKICLLLALVFQSSPLRACGLEKVMTGESCHDRRDGLAFDDRAEVHCEWAGTGQLPADESPVCVPCQSKPPVERQGDVRFDVDLHAPVLLPFGLLSRPGMSIASLPPARPVSVGRVLPLLN